MSNAWRRSPQEVDPVSWFSGPSMPIVFGFAAAIQGIGGTILFWDEWSSVPLQFIAIVFFLGAAALTAVKTQPHRQQFGVADTVTVILIAAGGLSLSAAGTVGGQLTVEDWWPGIGVGATLVALAPYLSPRRLLIASIPTVIVTGTLGWLVFSPHSQAWAPVEIIGISICPVIVGGLGGVVFSYTIVSRTLALLETSAGAEESYSVEAPVDEAREAGRVARVSARVAPFLEGVARAGVITAADRTLAAQIARQLRTELVTVTDQSWLDVVASESGTTVSDPDRLADRMNESQRTALRALLVAATDSTGVDRRTMLIELRAQPDGSTAVALSIDLDLPEGRRVLLLAPHYLTLKTTVEDLSWDDGRSLLLRFRIPPTRS